MAKRVLNVITSAYRGTLEEQDDTIVWLSHALKGAGADLDVLLEGNAVNYTVKGQDASGLSIGAWKQTQPPRIDQEVEKLMGKGVRVYVCEDDLAERGIDRGEILDGVQSVARAGLAKLFDDYDLVWRW